MKMMCGNVKLSVKERVFSATIILQYCENMSEKWYHDLFQSFAKTRTGFFD